MNNLSNETEQRSLRLLVDNILASCPEIDPKRNYWLIRTDGGSMYDLFLQKGLIAISYEDHLNIDDSLLEPITYTRNIKFAKKQITKFSFHIKQGDLVVIPSKNSKNITFGIVSDEITNEGMLSGNGVHLKNAKFRKVEWTKTFDKSEIPPKVLQMLKGHQAVYCIKDYAKWLDPMLYDFFKKGDKYNLRINIKSTERINFRSLSALGSSLLELSDLTYSHISYEEDTSEIYSYVNLNSPGTIDLITKAGAYLCLTMLIMVTLSGGEVKANSEFLGLDFDLKLNSIIDKASSHFKSQKENELKEILIKKALELRIENSNEIISLIGSLDADTEAKSHEDIVEI